MGARLMGFFRAIVFSSMRHAPGPGERRALDVARHDDREHFGNRQERYGITWVGTFRTIVVPSPS